MSVWLCAVRRLLTRGVALTFVALLTGCRADDPQNTLLGTKGPVADRLADLYWLVFWVAAVIFVLVTGLLLYIVFRYRARREGELPPQVHGNTRLEIAWTIAPALVLAVIAVPTISTLWELSRAPDPAEDPLEVRVIAHQWWWEFQYPQYSNAQHPAGVLVTAGELHIPVGRTVYATLESADIIHSFWIPKLAGKQDVTPGHVNHLTFRAREPGVYLGQCVEFCGISHANMRLRVIAQTPDRFEAWIRAQRAPAATPTGQAERGAQLFQDARYCAACHTVTGTRAQMRIGPDLTHFASRSTFAGATFERTAENLTRWIKNPPAMKPGAKMPVFEGQLTEEQIADLVAYLQSLE